MSDNTIVSVFGRKGSGKTTLALELCQEHERVVVIDSTGEYPFEISEGFEACAVALERAEERDRFRLSLRGSLEDLLDALEVCNDLTRALVVVEETSFYCSPSDLPEPLSRLVRYGRHRELDQLYISRRAAEVSRDLTAQSDVIVTFNQREPRDLDYLARVAGADVSAVRELPPYRVAAWGDVHKFPLAVWERLEGEQRVEQAERAARGPREATRERGQ